MCAAQAAALAAENETLRADKRVAALEAELDGVRQELAAVSLLRLALGCRVDRVRRRGGAEEAAHGFAQLAAPVCARRRWRPRP